MVGDLEEWLGYELDPAVPNEHPSIGSLSRELAADDKLRAAFANRSVLHQPSHGNARE
jgi:hypothetical protein